MNREGSQPPAMATWLLQQLCPKENQEELTGDLFERFSEGRSDAWFWRQVLIAIAIGLSKRFRAHWAHVAFSIAATTLLWYSWREIIRSPAIERLWAWGISLPWPLSSVYDFSFKAALAAAMVQPILAAFLLLDRAFSWVGMLKSFLVSFPLLAAIQAAPFFVGPLHLPAPITLFLFRALIPGIALLISAWVGCRLPRGSRDSTP
jgi:hypothetical protein